MALALRGTAKTGSAANGLNVTLTFDVGAGAPQQNDIVILFGGHPHRAATAIGPSTAGYTQIAVHTAAAPNFGAWYKVMGAVPDTDVVGQGTGNGQDATAYAAYVISGANIVGSPTEYFDNTAVTSGPTTGTNPDAAAITTRTSNAWVIAMAGSQVLDTTPGTVSGYSNQINTNGDDNNDITIAGATLLKAAAGSENPGAWSSWSSGAWYAITIAVREQQTITTVATLTTTDANDTNSQSGGVRVVGTLSTSDANDSVSQDTDVIVSGSSSTTDSSDSVTQTAGVIVTATLSGADANDSFASTASVLIAGSSSTTDANDAISASAGVLVLASSSTTDSSDSTLAEGEVSGGSVTADSSTTDANDSVSKSGSVLILAASSVADSSDSMESESFHVIDTEIALHGIVSGQAVSSIPEVVVTSEGDLSTTDDNDASLASASVLISASSSITEDADSNSENAVVLVSANLSGADESDDSESDGFHVIANEVALHGVVSGQAVSSIPDFQLAEISCNHSTTDEDDTCLADGIITQPDAQLSQDVIAVRKPPRLLLDIHAYSSTTDEDDITEAFIAHTINMKRRFYKVALAG